MALVAGAGVVNVGGSVCVVVGVVMCGYAVVVVVVGVVGCECGSVG